MHYKLILWDDCDHTCPGCVNKSLNPSLVTTVPSLDFFDPSSPPYSITLTGGEPAYYPSKLHSITTFLRTRYPKTKLYCYLASYSRPVYPSLLLLDGITYTIHYPITDPDILSLFLIQNDLRGITKRNPSFSSRLLVDSRYSIGHLPRVTLNSMHWSSIYPLSWKDDGSCSTSDTILKLSKEVFNVLSEKT